MVMISKIICGVAAFSSALLAGAARVDDEQAQKAIVTGGTKEQQPHAMAAKAEAEMIASRMSEQTQKYSDNFKDAERMKKKAAADCMKAKKDVDLANEKEAAASKAHENAAVAQANAEDAKEKQQHVYGAAIAHVEAMKKKMKKATDAKVKPLADVKAAEEWLARLQDEHRTKATLAAKDAEISTVAEATYKVAKAKVDELATLGKRVSKNKVTIEKIAGEAQASAQDAVSEEKKLNTKLEEIKAQKISADLAASTAQAQAERTDKTAASATGLAFDKHQEKVEADQAATEAAKVAHALTAAAQST